MMRGVSPAPEIHPLQFGSLNESFYHAEPSEYLVQRLWSLAASLDPAAQPSRVQFGQFSMAWEPEDILNDNKAMTYVALESMVLLHHAAESMLRLYMAHAHRNPCPWVEIAKLRNFAEFKRRLARLRDSLSEPEVMNDLKEVFMWAHEPAAFPEVPEHVRASNQAGLRLMIEYAVSVLLEDAPVYNAAKHGIAVLSGDVKMELGDVLRVGGPSLTTLEEIEVDGARKWAKRTRWVHPTKSLTTTFVISNMIRSLWESARGHYLGRGDPSKLYPLDEAQIRKLLDFGYADGFNVTTMTESLIDVADVSERESR